MTEIPTIVVTPRSVADTYRRNSEYGSPGSSVSFATSLNTAMGDALQTGHSADVQSLKAVSGEGNLTDVVTALSKAELTLQTVITIRDKVVQAFQDIMKMPI